MNFAAFSPPTLLGKHKLPLGLLPPFGGDVCFGSNNISFIRGVRRNCLREIKGQSIKYSKWNSPLKEYEKLEFYGESECKLC